MGMCVFIPKNNLQSYSTATQRKNVPTIAAMKEKGATFSFCLISRRSASYSSIIRLSAIGRGGWPCEISPSADRQSQRKRKHVLRPEREEREREREERERDWPY